MAMENSKAAESFAARLLMAAAVLSLVAVLHHPVLPPVHGAAETVQAIRSLAGMDRLVHGALIVLFALQTVGFYYFSAGLGFRRPVVMAGFVAYAAGALTMIIPATLDGFVTPDLVEECAIAARCGDGQGALITLIAVAIQDFTKIALAATSIAILCWGAALIGGAGRVQRVAGLVGLACALAPLTAFAVSRILLVPGNLAVIVAAQLVWNLAAATAMLARNRG
jgi:hypothetical protein